MFRNYTCLTLLGAVALTACSVVPESPIYTQTQTQTQAPRYAQPINASYQTAQNSTAVEDCKKRETNRELIGGAVGGAAGAYAGKKLIGGTKGTIAGAALGGIAGYGIGDISADCSPATSPSPSYSNEAYSNQAYSNTAYQSAPNYGATPANYAPISCPIGTKPHQSSGTCLLDDANASLTSATFTGVQSRTVQRAQIPTRSENIITSSAAPIYTPVATPTAPSAYRPADVTRQSGTNYGGTYRVVTGDTVYSLSRKLCVPVTAIQTSNGLDSNYGIQIGQSLNLPNSQC